MSTRAWTTVLHAHLGSGQVSRVVYGAIIGLALVVALGISFPAVFFALAALGAMDEDTAFTVAKWSGLGLISFYGYWAGRLSGAGQVASVLHALAVGLVGAALIVLKALIH